MTVSEFQLHAAELTLFYEEQANAYKEARGKTQHRTNAQARPVVKFAR